MNKILILLITVTILLFTSCTEKTRLTSIDKSTKITVIREGEILYIMDGFKDDVPDTNFVKLRLIEIDLGSQIVVCWGPKHYKWDLVADGTEVLINKLDTTSFKFSNRFPLDDRGIPTSIKYDSGENCGSFDTSTGEVFRNKGIVVE